MARFTIPRDLYYGKGALEALKKLDGSRAMVCVGGGSMKRFGFLDQVTAYLREAGCIPEIEQDFQETLEKSTQITLQSARKVKFSRKAIGILLKAIAPLM